MIQLAQTLADSAESVAEQLGNNPDKVYFPNFGDGDNILKSGIDVDRVMFTIPGTNFKIYWYGFLIAVGIILAILAVIGIDSKIDLSGSVNLGTIGGIILLAVMIGCVAYFAMQKKAVNTKEKEKSEE